MVGIFYVKYLIILIYVRGIVVFILYISCMCWYISESSNKFILFFILFVVSLLDLGIFSKFSDIGEFIWMYLFFRFMFNSLIISYSLNLFKISGSLRF